MIHLLYASRDGQTRRIAQRLAAEWNYAGVDFAVYNLEKNTPDPFFWPEETTVVILSPIRYGFPLAAIDGFIKKNKTLIDDEHLVMVSVNLTARKKGKDTARTNPYFQKWIKKHGLRPAMGAVFGGRLDYRRYSFWDKWAIRLIMSITGGPTSFEADEDYTQWDRVEALARKIALREKTKEEEWQKRA